MATLDGRSVVIANEVVPGQGEDRCIAQTDALGGLLCVADGCGGLGSRRYAKLDNRTEAYIASRLAVDCVRDWARALDGRSLPATAAEARACAAGLTGALQTRLNAFHAQHRNEAGSRLVMRGLQRTLPTTLCAALLDARQERQVSCLFFWAGDSRGYVLTADGLRQCTADHVMGGTNAMENLYRDSRLSNMIHADGDFTVDVYGLTVEKPCVVLTATDGAFGYLPTPMEFELLLLSTLQAAGDIGGWAARLTKALAGVASDDSSLALTGYGFASFDALKAHFAPRRAALQARYVTPVRRRRQNIDFARGLWEEYRRNYELSEEVRHADWRL